MNKNTFWFITLLFALAFGFASCAEDTPVEDPHANWEERNEQYLDSIVRVARNHPAGENWEIYKNYKINSTNPGSGLISPDRLYEYDSVYVKVLTKGDGVIPMSTDTVEVAYQGFLMNGERFDGTYFNKFDPEVNDNFTKFNVSGVIVGWTTALLHMNKGTFAEVYIPYQMAYGKSGNSGIPGFSVLKFEIFLNDVIHPKGPDDRSRNLKNSVTVVK